MPKSSTNEVIVARVFKHAGANYAMQNRIREAQDEGLSVSECAIRLNLEPKCVSSFYDHFQPPQDRGETDGEQEKAQAAKPAPIRKKTVAG